MAHAAAQSPWGETGDQEGTLGVGGTFAERDSVSWVISEYPLGRFGTLGKDPE
jgi:hypothetical protein